MKIQWQDYIARYVNLEIPMRDATILRADVYLPAGEGPFPAVVMRSPYLKSMATTPHYSEWGKLYANQGFAFVICDVRGRGDSDGVFHPFFNEMNDGYDTIEWLAVQPWCTGEIGMDGNSYNAHTAWMAVLSGAPHLKAMTVSGVPGDLFLHGTHYLNGIKTLYLALWLMMTNGRNMQIPVNVYGLEKPYEFLPDLLQRCLQVPAEQLPDVLGFDGRYWIESLQHDRDDGFWDAFQLHGKLQNNPVAALHVTGWFDNSLPGTIAGFHALSTEGRNPEHQYLVIGPWTHQANVAPVRELGGLDFGQQAMFDMLALKVSFFNEHLKHTATFDHPTVKVFDMGQSTWHTANDFPIAEGYFGYLTAHGILASPGGSTTLVYDPLNPTPSDVYMRPANVNRFVEREDVIRFPSETLLDPVILSGPVRLNLKVQVELPVADIIVTLCDRFPDGRYLPISFGGKKIEVEPGMETDVQIVLPYAYHTFLRGHEIVLLIQHAAIPLLLPSRDPCRTVISGHSTIMVSM